MFETKITIKCDGKNCNEHLWKYDDTVREFISIFPANRVAAWCGWAVINYRDQDTMELTFAHYCPAHIEEATL